MAIIRGGNCMYVWAYATPLQIHSDIFQTLQLWFLTFMLHTRFERVASSSVGICSSER
jgi:hypothetical protein